MTYKIVIGGCRNFTNYRLFSEYVDLCLARLKRQGDICILSGNCAGADALGERYALEHGYAIELYPADWETYGKSAGPIRNREMVKNADAVIAFWDGTSAGTASLISFAKRLNKPLRVKKIKKDGSF
jgi:hypothetical protein